MPAESTQQVVARCVKLFNDGTRAAQLFSERINKVAGEGGYLQRLNEQHINALNSLVTNLENQKAKSSVLSALRAEERLLIILRNELEQYMVLLNEINFKLILFFKPRLTDDVRHLIGVLGEINDRILVVITRIESEKKLISKQSLKKSEVEGLIDILKQEDRDARTLIRRCKPKELGDTRALYLALTNNLGIDAAKTYLDIGKIFKEEFSKGNIKAAEIPQTILFATAMTIVGPLHIFMWTIFDPVMRVLSAFRLNDAALMAEIERLEQTIRVSK